ncbi:radical SAM superfamily enzyme YgiQ (UPF0313 family) [Desulfosalsimonas propionicica]|uniref:Radical SAM superfamily enzyme YgiQ (UPF0313 family) n=1 Tax=Desulfosalsimonas propionicica TaxID=332175 RepID=A0A7W0CB93_9BACT|nr:radical SAM protein [Desulfosalsimonas propionicica]MBA2882555.1 radical SAM superfamily enzyme YgiQ (UPF0313 family) [Desulfosalsimonas propionicica]
MTAAAHILCINPWIHDFAAYDFWARPLGLLYLAGLLRDHGCRVTFIDCLDRFHPRHPQTDPAARCGRGPYRKTPIAKPERLMDVPRRYCRYGADPEWITADLRAAGQPDMVLVTSLMAYWYPGVAETIAAVRSVYPKVPVVLGGVYATLYPAHAARATGADRVICGHGEQAVFDALEAYTGWCIRPKTDLGDINALPRPALDLQRGLPFVPVRTSRGCPFSCDYCASSLIEPRLEKRNPEEVVAEIRSWHKWCGVRDVVFYDDALLVNAEKHADIIFDMLAGSGMDLRLHTPNALHVRNITAKTAKRMHAAGMQTLRLGVETTDFEKRGMDHKVGAEEFFRAAAYLREAGFSRKHMGAYLLAGLPNQNPTEVEASIDGVKAAGITPVIAWYSPILGTKMWDAACAASRYDLAADPLLTNNAVMPCLPAFSWELAARFKDRIQK